MYKIILVCLSLLSNTLKSKNEFPVTTLVLSLKSKSFPNAEGNRFVCIDNNTHAAFHQEESNGFLEIKAIILEGNVQKIKKHQLAAVRQMVLEPEAVEEWRDAYTACKVREANIFDEKDHFLRTRKRLICNSKIPKHLLS